MAQTDEETQVRTTLLEYGWWVNNLLVAKIIYIIAVSYDKINLIVNFLFFYCLITGNMDSARNREIRQVIKVYIYVNLELPEVITL